MINRIGQQLGNYKLIAILGQGGFAEVYLGEHLHLNSNAAIKVLKQQCTPAEARLFLDEARTMSRLRHPHIVRILDYALDITNTPYLVMDYAIGGTFRQRYPGSICLAADSVLLYVKQTASALDYMHQGNLVHQDVKPENLLLDDQDNILLSDFGIAFTTQQPGLPPAFGTIDYMAPEQIVHQTCAASDQYALGIVVYEWLCGCRPFIGATRQEIADKQINLPPVPPRSIVPGISPEVEEVVLRALAKDSRDRFVSVVAFADAFEMACNAIKPTSSAPTTQFHMQPGMQATLPAQAQVLVPTQPGVPLTKPAQVQGVAQTQPSVAPTIPAGGWFSTQPGIPPTMPGALPLPVVRGKQGDVVEIYTGHSDFFVRSLSWSLDGRRVASGGDDQTVQIWNPMTGENHLTYLGHTDQVRAIMWAPTGQRLVSACANQEFRVWDGTTGQDITIYHGHTGKAVQLGLACSVGWSWDSQWIVSGSADWTAQVWNADTGDHFVTYSGHQGDVQAVAWSRDGKQIATASYDRSVRIWDVASGTTTLTYNLHTKPVWALAWSLDSNRIASAGDDQTVQLWDTSTGEQGNVRIYRFHAKRVRALAWSLDGSRLASAGLDQTVQIWNVDTGEHIYTYRGHKGGINALAWSPDGMYLASASDDQTVHIWQTQ